MELPVSRYTNENGHTFETIRVPLGVVGALAPWNFPMTLAIWKLAPALLSGNTIVVKPSPFTPLTTLRFGELARDILPPGVMNIISGDHDLGPALTSHPGIAKIAFTGSTATGKRVMASAAENLARVTLELGGNDAAIVMDDADIEEVTPLLFWGAFRNCSQYCLAIKRLYIHESIYDKLKDSLVQYAQNVIVGNGLSPDSQIGPIQNKQQFSRVQALLDGAKNDGLSLLYGRAPQESKGNFMPVVFVDNPPEDADVVTKEAFGPILPLLKFSHIEDVISRANQSEYGLGGSVWSKDEEKAKQIARQLDTGTIWINHVQVLSPNVAFGGHKQSGVGVENSVAGLLEYTNTQTMVVKH